MRTVSTLALGIALALGVAAQPALAAKEKAPKVEQPKYSQKEVAAFQAVKAAADKGDIPTATAKAAEAEAAISNDDDKYLAGQAFLMIAQKTKDTALQNKAVDLMVASGKAPADQLPILYLAQAQSAQNAKDYTKALAALQNAQKAGSTEPNLMPMIVEMQSATGQTVQALQTFAQSADQMTAAGKQVPEDWYRRAVGIGYNVKPNDPNKAAVSQQTVLIAQKWVAAYPTKAAWHDAIAIYRDQYRADQDLQTDALRLQRATGSLNGRDEYLEYAENVYVRLPNEAVTVINEGTAAGLVKATDKNAADVLQVSKGKLPQDKATLTPAAANSAKNAANGRPAMNTADSFASYGDHAKAIDLYKAAIAKGGVDVPTATLRLGVSQALSGDTAGAKATFATVTGPKKPLADMWALHLDKPTVG